MINFLAGESIMLRLSDDDFRVDLLSRVNIKKDLAEAFKESKIVEVVYGGIYFLSYADLIDEKIRAKRPKDLLDIEQLRKIQGDKGEGVGKVN